MRLFSFRLIVSLILGITLVSAGFSYYEVLGQKRALRSDVERRDEVLGESLVGNVERSWDTGSDNRSSDIVPDKVPNNELQRLVQRFGNREHLLGVVIYDRQGYRSYHSGADEDAHRESAAGRAGHCAGPRRKFVRPAGKRAGAHSRVAGSPSG